VSRVKVGRAIVDTLLAEGFRFVFGLPGGPRADDLRRRVVYVDSTRDLPGMIELVEHTEAQERHYTGIYLAAVDWNGREPIRRDGFVSR
jgi:hypothetical protein